jgi:hypothetical protein
MTYEQFHSLILEYQKLQNDFSTLYKMGFDFLEGQFKLEEAIGRILDVTLKSNFTEEGEDWINWFMFENDFGEKDWSKLRRMDNSEDADTYGARDENGNPICFDIESTWEYVKQYLKK